MIQISAPSDLIELSIECILATKAHKMSSNKDINYFVSFP